MSNFKSIRERLGVTQLVLATGMGCTQGNVSFYEKGQTIPPDAAKRLIEFAATLGHPITFNDIYGEEVAAPLTTVGAAPSADRPLTTNPSMQAELDKAAEAGLVLLPKKAPVWDGVERRHLVRRSADRERMSLDIGGAGQGV